MVSSRFPGRVLQIPCFSVAYKYYDGQLASLGRPVVDSMTRSLKLATYSDEKVRSLALEAAGEAPRPAPPPPSAERESSPEQDPVPPKLTMGTALFELYLSTQQFHKYESVETPNGLVGFILGHILFHFTFL